MYLENCYIWTTRTEVLECGWFAQIQNCDISRMITWIDKVRPRVTDSAAPADVQDGSCWIIVRSRANRVENGEKNTRYFINLEKRNKRPKNKTIRKLYNDSGTVRTSHKDILSAEREYFEKIYSSCNPFFSWFGFWSNIFLQQWNTPNSLKTHSSFLKVLFLCKNV